MIDLVDTDLYTLKGEPHGRGMFLHFEFLGDEFTKSTYTKLLDDWVVILEELKEAGVLFVGSIIPKCESKIIKWQNMFGLEPRYCTESANVYWMDI